MLRSSAYRTGWPSVSVYTVAALIIAIVNDLKSLLFFHSSFSGTTLQLLVGRKEMVKYDNGEQ